MSRYLSPQIRNLQPYVPGEQPGFSCIKLNTNENPYAPPPGVLDAARRIDQLELYPHPDAEPLRSRLAAYHNVRPENIMLGNGSDEILAFTFLAFFRQARPLLMPDVTYSFYRVYAELFGIQTKEVPVRDDFSMVMSDYSCENGGVMLANPNAPSGLHVDAAEIAELVSCSRDSVVAVDEAYIDFGGQTSIPLIKEHPNLLVIRTFSKSRSLAGLRLGYAVGDAGLIEDLLLVKNSVNSFTVDRFSITAGLASLENEQYFLDTLAKIIEAREWAAAELSRMGFLVVPSSTNFLLVRPPHMAAKELLQRLREQNILVRHFEMPRISEYLRITIGSLADMWHLVEVLGRLDGL